MEVWAIRNAHNRYTNAHLQFMYQYGKNSSKGTQQFHIFFVPLINPQVLHSFSYIKIKQPNVWAPDVAYLISNTSHARDVEH